MEFMWKYSKASSVSDDSSWRDSSKPTWSRLCHSKMTSPLPMSISWTIPSITAPSVEPPRDLRRLFGAGLSYGRYQHLVHPPPVHLQDLEGVPLVLEAVARGWHAPQGLHHHAAHRLVARLFSAG